MASILALPWNAQTSLAAALDVRDCTRFSIALGHPDPASSSAGIAPGLLSHLHAAEFPRGHQPSAAVWLELSALRALKLQDLSSLDPCRFLVFKHLTKLEVGRVLIEEKWLLGGLRTRVWML